MNRIGGVVPGIFFRVQVNAGGADVGVPQVVAHHFQICLFAEVAARHIEQASTHWMRHTAGSHLSEKADLKVVRDNLGHANISTTSIYLHSEEDARHDATNAVHRVGWGPAR